jgi:hypothetical protein
MSDVSGDFARTPEGQRQYDLYGGVTLAVLGAILLATSFMVRNPVPLSVRGAIVIFIAAGVAVTMRYLLPKNQQDFYGGMALIYLALIAFVASNDLPGMRGFENKFLQFTERSTSHRISFDFVDQIVCQDGKPNQFLPGAFLLPGDPFASEQICSI